MFEDDFRRDYSIAGAANRREHVVGVGTDKADGPDDNHQNDGQHDRIFCDVLSLFVLPKCFKNFATLPSWGLLPAWSG